MHKLLAIEAHTKLTHLSLFHVFPIRDRNSQGNYWCSDHCDHRSHFHCTSRYCYHSRIRMDSPSMGPFSNVHELGYTVRAKLPMAVVIIAVAVGPATVVGNSSFIWIGRRVRDGQ
ncbi:hypothetical protein BDV39DRAFT_167055 [Aspergillus sergii]|uniref:Uncharacterized protein n=1 Tax=Aspergillus sergii TaxID=1034303 RepID=A0A5N6XLJ0_9EURO|nr:hypothetical protein BDV39DRAFT_167055 [Aspergillus sergii]